MLYIQTHWSHPKKTTGIKKKSTKKKLRANRKKE